MSALAQFVKRGVQAADKAVRPIEDSLVASHNISQNALSNRMYKDQTLLNPSVGVHKAGMTKTAESFGTGDQNASEVTLFLNPQTVDRGKLFEADSFSSVFPKPTSENKLEFPDGSLREYNDDSILDWFRTQGDVLAEGSMTGRYLPEEDLGHVFAHMADARGPVAGMQEASSMRGQLLDSTLTREQKQTIIPTMRKIGRTFGDEVLNTPLLYAMREVKITPGKLRGAYLSHLGEASREGLTGPLARKQARERSLAEIQERVPNVTPESLQLFDTALRQSGLKNAKEWEEMAEYVATTPREYMELKTGDRVTIGKGKDADAAVVWDYGQEFVEDTVDDLTRAGVEVKRIKVQLDENGEAGEFMRKSMLEEIGPWLRAKGKLFVFGGVGIGSGMLIDGQTNTLHAADLPGSTGEEVAQEGQEAESPPSEPVGPIPLTSDGEPVVSADKAPPTSAPRGINQALRRQGTRASDLFSGGSLEQWHRNRPSPLARFKQPASAPAPTRTRRSTVTPTGLERLALDEGERLKAYKDTEGFDTIGVGFNLDEPSNQAVFQEVTGMSVAQAKAGAPITKAHSRELLERTVATAQADAAKWIPDLASYPENVQDAITNFVFNVGLTTALDFKTTRAAIMRRDGEAAAKGLLNSRYARQVGKRAERVAEQLRTLKQ